MTSIMYGPNYIFQDANDRPYPTQSAENMLQGNIERIILSAMSPDMNPIEHVRDYLVRAISNRNNCSVSLKYLTVTVQEECDYMPNDFTNNLNRGMPRCIRQWMGRRGNHTEYYVTFLCPHYIFLAEI